MNQNLLIGDDVDVDIRNKIINIIKDNWDSFCERGVSRPMLDFEFFIDRETHHPFVAVNLCMASTKAKL